jgi:hypothetical protein
VDNPIEIRVAQGIYRPYRSSAHPNETGDREASFQLLNGVTIRGGYAGLGMPNPNARDINGDYKVDFDDVAVMVFHWLENAGE